MSLLVIDIGNSSIAISVHAQEETQHSSNASAYKKDSLYVQKKWLPIKKLSTQKIVSNDIHTQDIEHFLSYTSPSISCIAISSVVPTLTARIEALAQKIYSCPIHTIHTAMNSPLQQPIPKELGSDLFANAVSSYIKSNGKAAITVDFGTALSFTVIRGNGSIAGVSIAPGINTSLQSLVGNTALLHNITLQYPSSVLGKNTEHALQSGIILGSEQLVLGLCKRIKTELQEQCYCYATGGNTTLFPTLRQHFDEVDPYHTIKGIAYIAVNK